MRAAERDRGRSLRAARGRGRRAGRCRARMSGHGPSATIRPADRITARSHSVAASGRSWVTTSIVRSTLSSSSISSRRVRGSRLADGSSSTSRLGRIASTVAIATRRRWPSESWCGARSASSCMRTARERLGDPVLDLLARAAAVERAERDVLADGRHEQLVVGVLEDEPDAGAQVADVVVADAQAGDLELALALQQRVELEHQRRLAGAVGAEDGDALAVGDVQVDAVEAGDAVRVGEPQAAGVDRAAHAAITRTEQQRRARARRGRRRPRACSVRTFRRGIVCVQPRASIARWTRSARS